MIGPRPDPPDWRSVIRRHFAEQQETPEPAVLDELAQHLGDLYEEAIAHGNTHAEALKAAESALPIERERLVNDVVRAKRGLPGVIADRWAADPSSLHPHQKVRIMADLRRDGIHALRQLRRAPGYTLTAIATLALGIGGTTAIFAAVDKMLLRPLPYAGADRMVVPVSVNPGRNIDNASVSFGDYLDWSREKELFESVALFRPFAMDITGGARPERVDAALVSQEFFDIVTATPHRGRLLGAADYTPGSPAVVVVSHGLWQQLFGADEQVIGRSVSVGGTPSQVVGVLPPSGVWPEDVQAYIPLRTHLYTEADKARRDNLIFFALARLAEGASIESGNRVLTEIAARLEREHPQARKGWTNRLAPIREYIVSEEVRQSLWLLMGAAGAVLFIGCVNLANLGLVRGLARAREFGVRAALGASRWRLVRQLLAEIVLLSAAGAVAGAALAVALMRGLVAMAPADTPLVASLSLDPRVLLMTMVVTTVAVVIAGLVPALTASKADAGVALKDGSAGSGSSRRVRFLRHALTVAEIAGAVVLLCGAALLIQSYARLTQVDSGVDVDRVLMTRISLPGNRYPSGARAAQFYQTLVGRLEAAPGIESAGATSYTPVGGGGFGLGRVFLPEGRPEPPVGTDVSAQWNVVTPGYFETMGIPVLRGRDFDARDLASSTPVAVVSRSFAERMFGDESPIGKRVRSWRDENVYREIVGVVDEVRYRGLAEREVLRQFYVPHPQNTWGGLNVVVRAAGTADPAGLESVLRRTIGDLDGELAMSGVRTLRSIAGASISEQRYATLVLGLLAATAVVLGALGIYGVVGHAVSMRAREFGVRSALGGSTRHLYGLVIGQGLRLALVGLTVGIAASLAVAQVFESLLFQTAPRDPVVYIVTALLVISVALLASFGPARRAAKADPLSVLRT